MDLGWYVYGIVDEAFEAPPMSGVDDEHALEVVAAGGLAALTSRVPLAVFGEPALQGQIEDLAWLERHARRHERILEGALEQRATVVPLRLFTIYESTDSLRRALERERAFLLAALARLAGCTEWGVELFADPAAQSAGELPERAERAHGRLAAAAVEARVNPLQPPELGEREGAMLMSGAYLVDHDVIEAFSAAVTSLRYDYAGEGIDIVLTGPRPPFDFVDGSAAPG